VNTPIARRWTRRRAKRAVTSGIDPEYPVVGMMKVVFGSELRRRSVFVESLFHERRGKTTAAVRTLNPQTRRKHMACVGNALI